jgi:hypothetical protein
LLEFVFALPFLALLIAATFFFGTLMRNQQRLRVADHYWTWRQMHNRQAEDDGAEKAWILFGEPDEEDQRGEYLDAYRERNTVELDTPRVNELILQDRAEEIRVDGTAHWSVQPREFWVEASDRYGSGAGALAQRSEEIWPGGVSSRVDAYFPRQARMWDRIESAMTDQDRSGSGGDPLKTRRHVRDGVTWRRGQSSYLEPMVELFLDEFDDAVGNVSVEQLRSNLMRLYRQQW